MSDASAGVQMVTVTIDDQDYQVPAGMALIDAISEYTGFVMPRFCYHDRLDPVGMCRMCMAEVEARGRWANVATCTLKVADGMKVRVKSEDAIRARKMVLELLLVNHPLDCPVCDKGGECMLQDQAFAHGPEVGRSIDARRKFPKPLPISPDVLLDRERCIQCGLCVRYVDEVAAEKTIMLINRGGSTQVAPALDGEYDSHFAGNTCDICPVGALTSSTFRFASRPWEMERRAALSPWDACGTNLWLDVRQNVIRRVLPRENRAVNDLWCSDRDRFHATDWVLSPERLDVPLVRNPDSGQLEPASFDDALAAAVEGIVKAAAAGQRVGTAVGTHLGLEEMAAAALFAGEVVAGPVATGSCLATASRALGAMPTLEQIEKARAFLVIGQPATDLPMAWLRMVKAMRKKGQPLYTIGARDLHLSLASSFDLACAPGQETQVLEALTARLLADKRHNLKFIRGGCKGFADVRDSWSAELPDGVDEQRAAQLADKLAGADDLVVFCGWQPGPEARRAAWNLALLLGAPGTEQGGYLAPTTSANSRGAVELGLAGPAALNEEALGALLVLGSDLGADSGNPWQVVRDRWLPTGQSHTEAPQAGFLVVTELFMTQTARRADVVLPASCCFERPVTYVNFEGRIQHAPAAVRPIVGVRSDLDILNAIAAGVAERLGKSWEALTPETALASAGRLAPHLAAATNLPQGGALTGTGPADGRFHFV